MTQENQQYLTNCCDVHPTGDIDFDSVDGYYGEPIVVATAECPECHQTARISHTGGIEY